MWVIILAGILAFLLYYYAAKSNKSWLDKGIPHPKPLPFVGNMGANLLRKKSFAELTQEWYHNFPESRCVGFYQFLLPTLMVRDLKLIKQITVKEFDAFRDHRPFVSEDVDPLWSKNLAAMKGGEKWQDMRSTLSPSFTSSKMRMMFNLMKNCAKQFSDHFQKQGGTVTIEMKDAFTRFTNDVIATTAFGVSCNSLEDRENEFYLISKEATNFSGIKALKFLMFTISPTLMKLLKIKVYSATTSTFFRKLIKDTLRVREENNIVRLDMIHLLMEARKGRLKQEDSTRAVDSGFAVVQESNLGTAQKKEKPEITDEDITAQAMVFLLGGFDTSSILMCFAAYELAVNPDVQKKLQEEVDSTLENCKGEFTYEALLGMKYLDLVISETLRKWPPAPTLDRMSVEPFTIEPELPGEKPITLEKGTNIWIPVYAVQRDPKYYPDPEKFDPERFNDENKLNIKSYTYFPFGLGPRNCIGSRFALLEGKLVIAELVRKFEIVPVAKTQIPLQLDKTNFTLKADRGVWLGLKPRSDN